MSHKAVNWAYAQQAGLDIKTKAVLAALADWADGDGFCYPGQQSLATKVSSSERTVRRLLEQLESLGYIERARRSDASGRRLTDGYQLRVVPPVPAKMTTGQNEGDNRPTVAATEEPSVEPSVSTKTRARGKAHPLPDDWTPTPEHAAMCASRGIDVEEQALMFRLHAEANGRLQVVWNAAFSQWLMNARPQRAYVPNTTPRREVAPAPRYPDAPPVPDDWEPLPYARPGDS